MYTSKSEVLYMKKSGKIALGLGALGGMCALIGGLTYASTYALVEMAMNREMPKIMTKTRNKSAGSDLFDINIPVHKEAIEKIKSYELENIEISAHDGVKLVGHYYPSEQNKRTIIAMHGWRSSWNFDFCVILDFWHDMGCNVLMCEQRGHKNSGGDYVGFGLIERYDVQTWANWVSKNKSDTTPIYLCGASMGATSVLMASALPMPDNVRGIIADSGFTSPAEIWEHVARKNLHIPYNKINSSLASKMCHGKISMNADEYSTIDAMKENKLPVMFIHGANDNFVPIEMTYRNYAACEAPKKLCISPQADHVMTYLFDKEQYERTVTEFWNSFD